MSGNWHSGRVLYALVRHFDWFQNSMMTETFIDGGIADLVVVTKAGYLTEIEIKISLSDWNADRTKDKFKKPRPTISRFFYAIPETLESKVPDWLPAGTGVLVIRSGRDEWASDTVTEIRAAKRTRGQKVDDDWLRLFTRNAYHRFWRMEYRRLAKVMERKREIGERAA